MTTARRQTHSLPTREPKQPAPSGEYRIVSPREARPQRQPRRVASEYLDTPIATADELPVPKPKAQHARPMPKRSAPNVISIAPPASDESMTFDAAINMVEMAVAPPMRSARPKPNRLETLDDVFDDADAPEAPDSLVQMMEGMEGLKVTAAAWSREMPVVPKAPSVPRMEAIRPPDGPLQLPISRATPRPLNERQIIEAFAKFGPAPTSIWQTPAYALRVRARKQQLKNELGITRERRSSDVALYEKALRHADDAAVRRGQLVMAVGAILLPLVIAILCVLL